MVQGWAPERDGVGGDLAAERSDSGHGAEDSHAAPEARSLSDRLRERFGPYVDPAISLEAPLDETGSADYSTIVLRHLAERPHGGGRYAFEADVDSGGQGAIFKVYDKDLRRHLAMKVTLGRLGTGGQPTPARGGVARDPGGARELAGVTPPVDSLTIGRFLAEAQITGQLDHPGIVPVHELGLDQEGRVYFTMKLVKGEDLKAVFARVHTGEPGWSVTRVLGLLLRACEAMSYAHAKRVIHRDLKPSNVMVGKYGEVYVMDWGLSRVLDRPVAETGRRRHQNATTVILRSARHQALADHTESPLVTLDGDIVGTPAYMPPEQARGDLAHLGPASDVYAMGAMLYHLLAGSRPYMTPGAHDDPRIILADVQSGPPRALHALAPHAPAELVAICERAMAREQEDRYPDMAALADDLRAYLEHRVVSAYETGALAELKKWIRRNPFLSASLAAVLLLAVAAAGVFGWMSRELSARNEELGQANERLASALGRESAAMSAAEASRALADANAQTAREQAQRAERERTNVLRLSAFQELEALQREAQQLWPATPDKTPAYDAWLARAETLVAGLLPSADGSDPGHRRQLELLRARALPQSDTERESDRTSHPRYPEYAAARAAVQKVEGGLAAFHESAREREPSAAQLALSAQLEEQLVTARGLLAELEAVVSQRRSFRFASEDDSWWHGQLTRLVAQLEAFADPATGLVAGRSEAHGWGIRERAAYARSVVERTLTGPDARRRWAEAQASIADRSACPAYDGMLLAPQLGLLPLGRDARSGLWEFLHVLSGDAPQRTSDDWLAPDETTGVVLVLIPGGRFWMGAQPHDPDAPNYDPQATIHEYPVHEVTLDPYFLSKYELTQGQWLRFTASNPSQYPPSDFEYGKHRVTLLNPVERVSWEDATAVLARMELELPTEAQWERAVRAGTDTPWSTGRDRSTLIGVVNLADQSAALAAEWPDIADWPELDDGYTVHAPVGRLLPNPFGLHETHGNVWEWCRDDYLLYGCEPQENPVVLEAPGSRGRIYRDGGYTGAASIARSAYRGDAVPGARDGNLGLRPARRVAP